MKFSKLILMAIMTFASGFVQTISAQSFNHGGHLNPDSLEIITVTGTAIVDSNMLHPIYFLDENNDGQADYHLNFGPYWYEPDSGSAARPLSGETVTIRGGAYQYSMYNFKSIAVYEINGNFWREPFNAAWNNFNGHAHAGSHHQGSCGSYAFDWRHDSLQTVNLSGTALVDTTFYYEHFYLDTDNDDSPDYFLNFGPHWYEPSSGAKRPKDGEQVSITGGLLNSSSLPMVIVYDINGQAWRDSLTVGSNLGAGWIHRNMSSPVRFHSTFDPDDWMTVNPGWNQGGMHGGMMLPDSLYCQILEVLPENVPAAGNEKIFAAYELGMYYPQGFNGMMLFNDCVGMMRFNSNISFQLHYNDFQKRFYNINTSTIKVKYWDDQNKAWIAVPGAAVNDANGTVTFSQSGTSNYLILTADKVTGIQNEASVQPEGYSLSQNYPNPFNPETNIRFQLGKDSYVKISIYNILGEEIAVLKNEMMQKGNYSVSFNGKELPSGIYFYKLQADNFVDVKKMELLK